MPLKDLPPDAQPREKLLARGPAALADAELLAIVLRTGTAGRGVLQMAQELLAHHNIVAAGGVGRGGHIHRQIALAFGQAGGDGGGDIARHKGHGPDIGLRKGHQHRGFKRLARVGQQRFGYFFYAGINAFYHRNAPQQRIPAFDNFAPQHIGGKQAGKKQHHHGGNHAQAGDVETEPV